MSDRRGARVLGRRTAAQALGLLLTLAVPLLLAGCAGAQAAPVRKIGLIAPFEGVGRELGYDLLPVVQGAIDVANDSGLLGRWRLTLVAMDDQLDPEMAAAQALALAKDPDVVAVIGGHTVASAEAIASALADLHVPFVSLAPLAGDYAAVYSLCPNAAHLSQALAEAAQSAGDTSIVLEGSTVVAAAEIRLRREQGWTGTAFLAPEAGFAWFFDLAGDEIGKALRATCDVAGAGPEDEKPEVALAGASISRVIEAARFASANRTGLERREVGIALAGLAWTGEIRWFEPVGDEKRWALAGGVP